MFIDFSHRNMPDWHGGKQHESFVAYYRPICQILFVFDTFISMYLQMTAYHFI